MQAILIAFRLQRAIFLFFEMSSVKNFVRNLSFKKSKKSSKGSVTSPSDNEWTSSHPNFNSQPVSPLPYCLQTLEQPSQSWSPRAQSMQPALASSFSSFQPTNHPHPLSPISPYSSPPHLSSPVVSPSAAATTSPLSQWSYEDIIFERRGRGLGFTLAGGIDRNDGGDGSIYVTKIIEGGVAALDGRLRVNDTILSVNGASFVGLTHRESVEVLKASANTVYLKVKRFHTPSDNLLEIDLFKPSGKGLGFTVAGGIGSQEYDGDDGIFITRITGGGIADLDGRLSTGDRLLAVNDISMTYMSHEEAVEALTNTRGRVRLLIAKSTSSDDEPFDSAAVAAAAAALMAGSVYSENGMNAIQRGALSPRMLPSQQQQFPELVPQIMTGFDDMPSFIKEQRRIVIQKNRNTGLGLTIVGGCSDGAGIFISSISPGGAADLNGQLRKGDQILSVNDTDLRGVTHAQATAALKATGERAVLLTQYRPEEYSRLEAELRQKMISIADPLIQRKTIFIRALFDYDPSADVGQIPGKGLGFSFGDVLHVIDANNEDDWWQARKVLPWTDVSSGSGLIPSRRRVESKQMSRPEFLNAPSFTSTRTETESNNIVNSSNKSSKRKSFILSSKLPFGKTKKENEDVAIFENVWPALSYESVYQVQNTLMRPVVIYGPMKDRINDDLIGEFPDRFNSCIPHTTRPIRRGEIDGRDYHFVKSRETMENDIRNGLFIEAGVYNEHLYGMSTEAIRIVAAQGKHCLLDVSTGAISRLQKAGIFPIAILIKPKSSTIISQWNDSISVDGARKVFAATTKLFQEYGQFFTAVVSNDSPSESYIRVKQIIEDHSQATLIWVATNENFQ